MKSLCKKIFLVIGIFFCFSCMGQEWYRQLPPQDISKSTIPIGKWTKRANPRMPMNSPVYSDFPKEEIELFQNGNFKKTYETTIQKGENTKRIYQEGEGIYNSKGNWILIETKKILIREYENKILKTEKIVEKESRVLYYFWNKENLIIPMIYEKGFEEKNFGVKDGIKRPYDESEANLYNYIRIYAYKEFQSHAYFLGSK